MSVTKFSLATCAPPFHIAIRYTCNIHWFKNGIRVECVYSYTPRWFCMIFHHHRKWFVVCERASLRKKDSIAIPMSIRSVAMLSVYSCVPYIHTHTLLMTGISLPLSLSLPSFYCYLYTLMCVTKYVPKSSVQHSHRERIQEQDKNENTNKENDERQRFMVPGVFVFSSRCSFFFNL